ncbi:hypothetical protein [Streptomyces brasiliensis]|uniref:hypothetical protein n=1 Tax=Streptomyces brasiliensis TaxID=1954 RepID=UPI0016715934|nr:hypothetical protein [Streptomyces brasiliensis]
MPSTARKSSAWVVSAWDTTRARSLTEHIRRFGEYSTHELGMQPEAYDPHLDVDFSPLRGNDPPAPDGYGQAA